MRNNRRDLLKAGTALTALGSIGSVAASIASVELAVDTLKPGRAVNPLVLGNNMDWSNSAQGMYLDASKAHPPGWLALADRLSPTALRYPGGTNSDFFRWKSGMGPVSQRGKVRTLEGKDEQVLLGTDEFLAFCRRWKSEPLITVNVATAKPEEAADWVRYCNRRPGAEGPRVRYWEIGNEPYLDPSAPETAMTPVEFGRRANACIRAMKAVDPSIECGLPLRPDTLGAFDGTKFKGFNNAVLAEVHEPFEWVASHGSYYPVTFEKRESVEALYLATMAGTRVLKDDMDKLRALMRERFPKRRIQLAYTEYNALYSLDILRYGMAAVFLSKTDRYIESMAGALYAADALRTFTMAEDVLMSNFWAICGNWWFGAISHEHQPRPQFHVLEAWRDFAKGQLLPLTLQAPTMATPKAGFVPAFTDTPSLDALAIDQGAGGVRLMVINRHPSNSAALKLQLPGLGSAPAVLRVLSSKHYFGEPVSWSSRQVEMKNGQGSFMLGPHALAFLHFARTRT